MSYYIDLLIQHGIKGRTIRDILAEVIAEPTDERLRVAGAVTAAVFTQRSHDEEIANALEDFLAILQVERDWLHRQGCASLG